MVIIIIGAYYDRTRSTNLGIMCWAFNCLSTKSPCRYFRISDHSAYLAGCSRFLPGSFLSLATSVAGIPFLHLEFRIGSSIGWNLRNLAGGAAESGLDQADSKSIGPWTLLFGFPS